MRGVRLVLLQTSWDYQFWPNKLLTMCMSIRSSALKISLQINGFQRVMFSNETTFSVSEHISHHYIRIRASKHPHEHVHDNVLCTLIHNRVIVSIFLCWQDDYRGNLLQHDMSMYSFMMKLQPPILFQQNKTSAISLLILTHFRQSLPWVADWSTERLFLIFPYVHIWITAIVQNIKTAMLQWAGILFRHNESN